MCRPSGYGGFGSEAVAIKEPAGPLARLKLSIMVGSPRWSQYLQAAKRYCFWTATSSCNNSVSPPQCFLARCGRLQLMRVAAFCCPLHVTVESCQSIGRPLLYGGVLDIEDGEPASETRCGCAHMALVAQALVTARHGVKASRPRVGFSAQWCHPPLLTRNPHARQVDTCRAESGSRLSLLPLYGMPHFLVDPGSCSQPRERNSMMRS